MKIRNRVVSTVLGILLSGAMILGMLPTEAMAAGQGATTSQTTQKGYDGNVQNTYKPGSGTTYYVDSEGGKDENEGTSEDAPFQTLAKVNEITLEAGDSILLKRGSIFDDQQLAPKGRGTEDEHILIGSYGDEDDSMPVINTNFKYREAILIENMEYVDITGIEVTNDDAFNETSSANDANNSKNTALDNGKKFRPLGVHILINEDAGETLKPGIDGDDRVYKGINLDGCYIHDVDGDENYNTNKLSGGVGIEIKYHNSNNRYPVFDGVTVQNNRIDQVDRCGIKAIRLTELDQNSGNGEEVGGDSQRYAGVRRSGKNQASLNYVVRNNYLTDIGGDGILVDSTRGALVENNLLYNHTMRATGANAGIWSWNAFDTVFQYNESYGGPSYNQDGCSYDSDYNSAGTIFQYNYSHDCVMGFMLIMGGNDTDIIRYNLSQNDGNVWRHIAGNSNTPSYIYNNVFVYDGANWRFVNNNASDDSQTQSIRNNWQYFNNIFYNTSKTTTSNWKIGNWDNAVTGTNIVYEASGEYADNEITDAIHANPKFVKVGGADDRGASEGDKNAVQDNIWSSLDCYKLQEGSPAIGAGTYVNVQPQTTSANAGCWDYESDRNATEDFYGNALYNGAPDIGLNESDKEGAKFTIEKNAIYRVMNPATFKYLTMTQGDTALTAQDKADEDQAFTIVGSGDDYKLRIWDDTVSAYRYLAVSDGNVILSEDEQTKWKLVDLKNGLFLLQTDGKNLTCSAEGTLSLKEEDGDAAQWYLELEEHSHAYNVGGKEIEGFSADQKYDEPTKQSGYYTEDREKFTTKADEEVYQTGVNAQEIGYKLYASDGEYTLRLYFAEPEDLENLRTMDILVNGSTVSEAYVLDEDTQELTLTGIYPQNGMIDVKVQAAYNSEGKKPDAVLCGISAEKQIRKEIVSRINAGGSEADGLIADAEYTTANGAGYYDNNNDSTTISGSSAISPDAGVGTAMKDAREGTDFGYKVKAMPGNYRVKLYFAELNDTAHKFNIYVNGEKIESDYNVRTEADGTNTAVGFVCETESKDGFVDVRLVGNDGNKAIVNAVIVEAYDKPDGDKLTVEKATGGSEQADKTAAMSIDGNQATRWASVANNTEGQYITFELEASHILNGIVLDWTPNAMAKDYHIDISDDGNSWETVATVTDAKQGLNVHKFDAAVGKYVRVVCDQKLNDFAISLTEAEIYGGAAVQGDAQTTVAYSDKGDSEVEITAGMGYVYRRYSTAEVKFQYDPAEVEYVDDSLKTENPDKLDAVSDAAINEENGTITQRFGLKQWNGFQDIDNPMLTAQFKNLTDSMTKVTATVSLTSSDGHVTELPSATAYLPAQADYALMSSLLAEAQELAKTAVVGDKRGEYPQESVDALNAAIQAAEGLTEESGEEEINRAARGLYDALELMKDTQVESKYVMYHKDFNDPDETAPAVTAGTSTVEDGSWNLALGTDAVASITDAEPLSSGYYYARLQLSNVSDQTLFSIVGEDGVRRLRAGWEPSYWFWDDSTNGYGGWGGGQAPTANTDLEVMIKFDSTSNNVTNATLWINGEEAGTISKGYTNGTGFPTFETRRNGKTFSVEELYFTNAEPVTLTVNSTGKGSVSQAGAVTSFMEADKTFYFTPEEGQTIESVKVDGQEVEWNQENNSYTFEYLLADHTLDVTFSGETQEEAQSYHTDYMVDAEADFSNANSASVADGTLNLTVTGTGDKQQVVTTAADQNAPQISSGTFYTRFSVNSSDIVEGAEIGQDQVLFDVKANGDNVIRIGFDYLQEGSKVGNWFYDKASSGAGWGNFPNGAGVAALTENEDHTLKLEFIWTAENTYDLKLTVDGQDMGTVTGVKYDDTAGSYGFGARRTTKNYTVKEVYYSNAKEYELTVTGGENGTVSQTGTLPTFAGTDKTIFFTPAEGYKAVVTVDGTVTPVEGSSYTFENIQGNHTLAVSFVEDVPEQTVTYHQDYMVDTTADFEGDRTTATVGDNVLNIAEEGWNDKQHDSNPAIAIDQNAPAIDSGTFYTRFSVNSSGITAGENIGQDQVLFDIKTTGNSMIRIGFDYLSEGSTVGNWFYDKATTGAGWGNFSNGAGVVVLTEDEDHTLRLDFTKTADDTYTLHLYVDGVDMGTVENVGYDDTAGSYGFGARRTAKNYTVKEVYYTNAEDYTINVAAGEGGTVSQTGDVTVFGNSSKTLFVIPNEGYEVDAVTVDGQPASLTNGQYTFTNIAGDHTFAVSFKAISQTPEVDKDGLQTVYDLYKDMTNNGVYTDESWTVFDQARTNAANVLADETADQDTVDAAKKTLQDAFDSLQAMPDAPVDKANLQKLYDQYVSMEQGKYTDASWAVLQNALETAKGVLDNEEATQDEVTAAEKAIADAVLQLEGNPEPQPAEKAELQKLFNENQNRTETDYTAETWAAFKAAMDKADAVLKDEAATQEAVDAAYNELAAAVEQLAERPEEPGAVDKSGLEALVNAVADKKASDYTKDSWKTFESALKDAQAVLADENATQEQIDAAQAALEEAIRGLVKAGNTDGQGTGGTGQGGSTPDKGGDSGSGSDKDKAAKTGDTAPVAGLFVLLVLSGGAVLVIRRRRRA